MNKAFREALNLLFIACGVFAAAMGLKGFLLSSKFIDGGVTGVSMLVSETTGFPLAWLIPLVNLPFIAIGYGFLGAAFAIRSTLAIAGLATVVAFVHFPDVTPDPLLTAVFGGFFIGAGIGLAMRGGAVLDGTEIIALLISKWSDLVRVGDVILIFNIVLFLLAIDFLGVQPALYSILTYYTAAKTLDFIVSGIDEYSAVTIVSDQHAGIREALIQQLGIGVTVYSGNKGVSNEACDILHCVATKLELGKVKGIVKALDRRAFVTIHALKDVVGGTVKQSGLH